ncbi:MAG: PilZ domain-containing protein [Dehalococcoidia bacterium]|nr:PilZ domain-containing protein [Dehalococcoidia bacterium]
MVDLSFLRPLAIVEVRWGPNVAEQFASAEIDIVRPGMVTVPLMGSGTASFPIGGAVRVRFASPGGLFLLDGRVIGYDDRARALTLHIHDYQRIQRRRYYRARVSLPPAKALLLTPDSGEPMARFQAELVDLSGGGARFESSRPLRLGDAVQLTFSIDQPPPIVATVAVLESRPAGGSFQTTAGYHIVRSEFRQISDRDRDRIIKYIFRLEVAERRKAAEPPAETTKLGGLAGLLRR